MNPRRTDNDEARDDREGSAGSEANDALDPRRQEEEPEDENTPSVEDLATAAAEAEADYAGDDSSAMRAALEQKNREIAEAQDRYLRTYAEFENYRKRTQRDMADFRKYANEQMALDLLTVVDHLGLAIKHGQESGGNSQGLQEGVELVRKQFLDLLEKYGIKPFKAEGEPFDPKLHDAMMQVETDSLPENTVAQVFQEGFTYHEKILRHARVGVSKRPADPTSADGAAATSSAENDTNDEPGSNG